MTSFEDVRSSRRRRSKGCPRCGAEANSGAVQLSLRELGPGGQVGGGNMVTTKSRSFCESCSVEVYQQLFEILAPEEAQAAS